MRHSVRDSDERGNPKLHLLGRARMRGAFTGTFVLDDTCGGRRRTDTPSGSPLNFMGAGGRPTATLEFALPTGAPLLRFRVTLVEQSSSRAVGGLTFDMRGGRQIAKLAVGRPLDGSVRPLVEEHMSWPCVR